ncbi:MAG: hypothetical protein Q7J20_00835 [Candidatus Nitrotoga sp.]|nr:hypothetical protein [Candidatus Nitrotoga sp.]MDO9446460.1 hypothetical protein [Candidatus Nitrotoga sp.]
MKSKFATLIIYSFCCASAFAAPAAWYQWKSKLNDERYCAQTSPGYGWKQDNGPYKDARCAIRARNDVATTQPDSKSHPMQSSGTSH